jgi:hypothetical protein
MLEGGRHRSLRELAAAEGTDRGYIVRTLRLTLLAPDVVEAILDGRQLHVSRCVAATDRLPLAWTDQRAPLRKG